MHRTRSRTSNKTTTRVERRRMRGTSARAEHIDIAKGISIVLVAMFHSPLEYYFNAVVEPMALFRLPLFFVLSGVFFSWRADAGTFLRKKADALLKPYAVVLGGLLLWHWVGGGDEIGRRFWGILYGNGDTIAWVPMWFLTHLFSVYAVAFFVCRITPLRVGWAPGVGLLLCLIVVAAFGIGALYGAEITVFGRVTVVPGLPFSLDLVVITGSLFIIRPRRKVPQRK
ncbi:MAG: acyltransferase family protein [Pseudomonadota bacterium]